jgi:hypothetical protein
VTTTSAAFTPEITLLNDPPSDFIPIAGSDMSVTGSWIIPAAMYRLRVSSRTSTGGTFTLTTSTTPTAGCILHTLLPFALVTYSGILQGSDCSDGQTPRDRYQIYSPKPCSVTLRGVSGLDPFLTLRNARTGQVIAENDNAVPGTMDAFVMLTECRDGTDPIEITATRALAGPNGAYSLIMQITGGVSLFSIGPGASK